MHNESQATPLREGMNDSFAQNAFTAAALSYRDPALGADRLPEGWTSVKPPEHLAADFATSNCDHFVSPTGDHFVSFRGTTDMTDWVNNVGQGSTAYRPQYDAAARIAAHFRDVRDTPGNDYNVTYTGHSLGGGKAQLAAEVASLTPDRPGAEAEPQICVAINAAPVHRETYRAHGCNEHAHSATILEIENEHDALTLARDVTPTIAGTVAQAANKGVTTALDYTPGVVRSAAGIAASGAVMAGGAALGAASVGLDTAKTGVQAVRDLGTGAVNVSAAVANAGAEAASAGIFAAKTGAQAVVGGVATGAKTVASGVGAVGGAVSSGVAWAMAKAGGNGPPSAFWTSAKQLAGTAYGYAAAAGDKTLNAASMAKDATINAATATKDAALSAASVAKDATVNTASAVGNAAYGAAATVGGAAYNVAAATTSATVGATVSAVKGAAELAAQTSVGDRIIEASGVREVNRAREMGDRIQIKLAGAGAVLSRDPASGHYMSSFDLRDASQRGKAPRITCEINRIDTFGAITPGAYNVNQPGGKDLAQFDNFKPPAQRLLAAAVNANSQGQHALPHSNDLSKGRG